MGNGIFKKGETVVCPVDASGCFTAEVADFSGQYVKVREMPAKRLNFRIDDLWLGC